MAKVFCVGGAPLFGKTTALSTVSRPGLVVLDNEWAFSMPMRVLCADKSGIELNSPEFVRAFNLRGQLDYQNLVRRIAHQGYDVVMPGPFEDLTPLVGDVPLLKKMQLDFTGLDLKFIQLIMLPAGYEHEINSENVVGHPAMAAIEEEIQRRREERGAGNEIQQKLDADKASTDYYSQRLRKQLKTYEAFPAGLSHELCMSEQEWEQTYP